jgi:hypothetical protein
MDFDANGIPQMGEKEIVARRQKKPSFSRPAEGWVGRGPGHTPEGRHGKSAQEGVCLNLRDESFGQAAANCR